MDRLKTKETIIKLLKSTRRDNIKGLVYYLEQQGFFTLPASRKNHNAFEGGLADHSLNVHFKVKKLNKQLSLGASKEAVIIAPICHDICKIGEYIQKDDGGWKLDKDREKGHALLSISRIKRRIKITELEEMMIRYHMGVYGLVEYELAKGEYTLRGGGMAHAWFHHPIVKIMYFCDELTTLEEKAKVKN